MEYSLRTETLIEQTKQATQIETSELWSKHNSPATTDEFISIRFQTHPNKWAIDDVQQGLAPAVQAFKTKVKEPKRNI